MRAWLRACRLRLWALLHRAELEPDLEDELSFHLDMRRRSDPVTLVGVLLLVLALATLASFGPAIRAARVDPMHVLRDE